MKKLLLLMVMAFVVIGITSCTDQSNNELIQLAHVEAMNFEVEEMDGEDIEQVSDHPGLRLYVHELKETVDDLETIKSEIKLLFNDTKQLGDQLKEASIQLSEEDRLVVGEALRSIQFNRYMFQPTIGHAYQQLFNLKENKDDYTQEEAKDILIDVYQVLKTREAIYHTIFDDLTVIHSILSTY